MKTTTRILSLLLTALILTTSLVSCGEKEEKFTPHQFGLDDAGVNGIRLTMTENEVTKILGKPDSRKEADSEFFISKVVTMRYGKLELEFSTSNGSKELPLSVIATESPDIQFAGGLHVGSTKAEILETFTHDDRELPYYTVDPDNPFGTYIYGNINMSSFDVTVPTKDVQYAYFDLSDQETEDQYTMCYVYIPKPYYNEETSYLGFVIYYMIFYMDSKTDTATKIELMYNNAV